MNIRKNIMRLMIMTAARNAIEAQVLYSIIRDYTCLRQTRRNCLEIAVDSSFPNTGQWDANETKGWTKRWTRTVSFNIRTLKQMRSKTVHVNETQMSLKHDSKVAKQVERSIAYLSREFTIYHNNGYKSVKRNWTLIQEEGVVEQQEIFEAQMLRLGEHDIDIRDYRSEGVVDFDDDYGSYASHVRNTYKTTKARYNGHHGYDW